MALNVSNIKRVFKHNGVELDDPGPEMSPQDVLAFYGNTYPELTVATVSGPEIKDNVAVYEFKTTVGVKG